MKKGSHQILSSTLYSTSHFWRETMEVLVWGKLRVCYTGRAWATPGLPVKVIIFLPLKGSGEGGEDGPLDFNSSPKSRLGWELHGMWFFQLKVCNSEGRRRKCRIKQRFWVPCSISPSRLSATISFEQIYLDNCGFNEISVFTWAFSLVECFPSWFDSEIFLVGNTESSQTMCSKENRVRTGSKFSEGKLLSIFFLCTDITDIEDLIKSIKKWVWRENKGQNIF